MSKSTTKKPPPQVHQLMAGLLPGDLGTELFANRETRRVYGMCNGQRCAFKEVSATLRAKVYEMMLADPVAMADLKHLGHEEALEEFAFCLFGAADHEADFGADGSMSAPENFMCGDNCRCLKWPSKTITLNGHPLTPRQLEVSKALASDDPDKKVAAKLGISLPTLSNHKAEIFGKAGVHSKAGFVKQAIKDKVIQ